MKIRIAVVLAAAVAALMATNLAQPAQAQPREKCTIALSHYISWDMIAYAKKAGIMKRWGDKYNVTLDHTEAMDYIPSLNLFASKRDNVCAVLVTNMDALTGPAWSGVDTTILVVQDTSNGNDGIVYRKRGVRVGASNAPTLKNVVGKTVSMVQGSVSEYLLVRAFEQAQLPINTVKIANTTDTLIGSQFASSRDDSVVVTWHPVLMNTLLVPGAHLIYDSSRIPGEIADTIAVHTEVSDNVKKAITGMWYELVQIFAAPGTPAYKTAVEFVGQFAEMTPAQIAENLKTTNLFVQPSTAVQFTEDAKLRNVMDGIRKTAVRRNWVEGATSPDQVGIQFPGGSVLGNPKNVRLRFDTGFMRQAAEGKL